MNPTATFLLRNIVSLACVIAASLLAKADVEGWGWFLFASLATFSFPD